MTKTSLKTVNEVFSAMVQSAPLPTGAPGTGEPGRAVCHAWTSSASQSAVRLFKCATGWGGFTLPPVRLYERHVEVVTPQWLAQSLIVQSVRPVSVSIIATFTLSPP